MSDKKAVQSIKSELESAKMEAMKIRFRRVLGEAIAAHNIRNARKNIAKCARSLQAERLRGKNA